MRNSEMVERVARAILRESVRRFAAFKSEAELEIITDRQCATIEFTHAVNAAHAAIEAMHEPTEEMLVAAAKDPNLNVCEGDDRRETARDYFLVMMGAALK